MMNLKSRVGVVVGGACYWLFVNVKKYRKFVNLHLAYIGCLVNEVAILTCIGTIL